LDAKGVSIALASFLDARMPVQFGASVT